MDSIAPAAERIGNSVLEKIRETTDRRNTVYRVILCGEIIPGCDRTELAAYYQKFMRQYQSDLDHVTGLLIMQPTSYLNIIEAS
ncbi:hypothetical protein SmJEL517_g06264 [Synchytrium microbalum]|uniref:Uncharacterized protein n=1 Tax=Synchytrium microbalum TaxID=1806994 RepID=A0A507BGB7_9FUNG|nr:uncharacterized protein SmJEL517_g06264 [Synchytrium microbalum]TPX30080.1 hypothetical protein SmJEL517_g06264 [Synchytrium microbalum]